MSRLCRKITPSKWRSNIDASVDNIPADAAWDLKTTDNTLSFWEALSVEGVGSKDDDAILAILGSLNRLETVDVVFIDRNAAQGVSFKSSRGETIVKDLENLHVDAIDLNLSSLHIAARAVANEVYLNKNVRITKAKVRERLMGAMSTGRIDASKLSDSLKKELS